MIKCVVYKSFKFYYFNSLKFVFNELKILKPIIKIPESNYRYKLLTKKLHKVSIKATFIFLSMNKINPIKIKTISTSKQLY